MAKDIERCALSARVQTEFLGWQHTVVGDHHGIAAVRSRPAEGSLAVQGGLDRGFRSGVGVSS